MKGKSVGKEALTMGWDWTNLQNSSKINQFKGKEKGRETVREKERKKEEQEDKCHAHQNPYERREFIKWLQLNWLESRKLWQTVCALRKWRTVNGKWKMENVYVGVCK